MDDIQRAIDYFVNEIRLMKKYHISLDCIEFCNTAISAMQELQMHKKGVERIKYALKAADISKLNLEYDTLSNALELMQRTKPIHAAPETEELEELQQYRATGLTPHMVEKLKENDRRSHQLAVQRAAELDEYKKIGNKVDKLYLEKCQEVNALQKRIRELESALTETDHVLAPGWQSQIMRKFTERR